MTNVDQAAPVAKFFTSQGLKLHYADFGNEAAPPLILMHGTRDHARSWDWMALALKVRFHVMSLDLRGHGDSAWSPDGAYLMHFHLLDLIEMIESLGCPQVSIMAHSFGGNFAARYAGLYPERIAKLVLVDSIGPAPGQYLRWDAEGVVARTRTWLAQRRDPRQLSSRSFATIAEAAARMAKTNPHLSAEQVFHLTKHALRQHEDGLRWKFDPRVSMFAPEDFEVLGGPFWKEITAPCLLFHGEKSWTTHPEKDGRAAYFKDQRTIAFADAGHWVHHDQFDAVRAAVEEFL